MENPFLFPTCLGYILEKSFKVAHFEPGECIITEANSGYVLYSKLERYYLLNEMKDLPLASEKEYQCSVNPFDKRYTYTVTPSGRSRNFFDF